jgi:hypothetical protein
MIQQSHFSMLLKEGKSGYNNICTPMFIAALFAVANYGSYQGAPQLMNG